MKIHPAADLFPMLPEEGLQQLAQDIKTNGLKEPICRHEGKILDGRNRFKACQQAGVTPHFEDYKGKDPTGHVLSLNLHRRHLNESQRALIAARLANRPEGRPKKNSAHLQSISVADAAAMLKVSPRIVATAKKILSESPEVVEAIERGEKKISGARVVANTGNYEWYTPPEYIEAARKVMGSIDLDPASNETANKWIKAKTYYTKEDDGLTKKWKGKVWMNPPFANGIVSKFTGKLSEHVNSGDVTEAIVVLHNATETGWFQDLMKVSSAIVFPNKRINFLDKDGNVVNGSPLQGHVFVYVGDNPELFFKYFEPFGFGVTVRKE